MKLRKVHLLGIIFAFIIVAVDFGFFFDDKIFTKVLLETFKIIIVKYIFSGS